MNLTWSDKVSVTIPSYKIILNIKLTVPINDNVGHACNFIVSQWFCYYVTSEKKKNKKELLPRGNGK